MPAVERPNAPSAVATTPKKVTADVLNVRSSPEKAQNVIGVVRMGEEVETIADEGEWVRIRFGGQDAFVFGAYLSSSKAENKDKPEQTQQDVKPVANKEEKQAATPTPHAEEHQPETHKEETKPAIHTEEQKPEAHKENKPPVHQEVKAPAAHPEAPKSEAHKPDAHHEAPKPEAPGGMFGTMHAAFENAVNQGAQHSANNAAPAHGAAPAQGPAKAPAQAVTAEEVGWTPPANSRLTDQNLITLASRIHDPKIQPLLEHLGGIFEDAKLAKKQSGVGNSMEYTDAKYREELVRGIAVVRGELEQLDASDANVTAFKVAAYHEIEKIAPYHFQKNIRAIETWDKAKDKGGKRQWTTCNLTSLAMCLEVNGIGAHNFPKEHNSLLETIAKQFEGDINEGLDDQGDAYQGAILTAKGKGTSLDKVMGFRLPDFLELAAIAYGVVHTGQTHDDKGISAGANYAANNKGKTDFLSGLAAFMGGTATTVQLTLDSSAKKNKQMIGELENYGQLHRGITTDGVEKMNTQRNLMENAQEKIDHATNEKERKRAQHDHDAAETYYNKLAKTNNQWLDNAAEEKKLPIETYANAVKTKLGPYLDAGKGVIAGLSGHYVRLYEITDTGVCVQDPGQWNRTEMRITWEEARAMGYFWVNLIISA